MLKLLLLFRPAIGGKQRASLLLALKNLVRSVERSNIILSRTYCSDVVNNRQCILVLYKFLDCWELDIDVTWEYLVPTFILLTQQLLELRGLC